MALVTSYIVGNGANHLGLWGVAPVTSDCVNGPNHLGLH